MKNEVVQPQRYLVPICMNEKEAVITIGNIKNKIVHKQGNVKAPAAKSRKNCLPSLVPPCYADEDAECSLDP
jgi:hypothetical protein